ncbi:hypothetical protein JCM3263A_10570 [Thermobifida fusca]|uniref:Uncharacterized protein n=1 Tax=Thermobifida fusca TM51 TaxID=1169414 RepID=A0A9P2TCV1_THEFU|nr:MULTISPECIES: DUF6703 family protein [Thermobifida]EOR72010.1 hypothetical protein TM51_04673 [Thermobifida fusca TM51]MBO2529249.1 hypothetical protein [Thermobifida sp.]MDD6792916.1 hypothetical protein [Thermobifida fusca]PPS92708.1 hypothetical protein BH05_09405 [Thermobifida fusca]PZN63428.1 MAG: hypothetical protein DIU53_08250 [Thermobifida fusca]
MSPKEHHTEPAGRRLPDEEPSAAAEVSRLRRAVEERSALPLLVLHHAPGWVLPVAVVGVFFSGLLLTGIVGTLLLVLLALFFAWLGYLAWPRLSSAERAMRCVVVAVLLGLGVLQSGIF